jgi:hypothetical protein
MGTLANFHGADGNALRCRGECEVDSLTELFLYSFEDEQLVRYYDVGEWKLGSG